MSQQSETGFPILMVDDEEQFLLSAGVALAARGFNAVTECSDSRLVMDLLREQTFSLILLDLIMPNLSGQELLAQIRASYPEQLVVMLTAINDVETVVDCMRLGAFDYILKPVDTTRLVTTIERARDYSRIQQENRLLRQVILGNEVDEPEHFAHIITANERMRSLFRYIQAVSRTPMPVLITGETGTGKELFAAAVHHASKRQGHFIPVNVAGLDDHLFSDALFGHKRGAFTGADRDRQGLIEKAEGGTLFLDEIGDLRPESQVKLLRLLQSDSRYYPLGSDKDKPCNARFVLATNANLEALQKNGSFRTDLYYRLRTHHLSIPALRERKDDLPVLIDYFFAKISKELDIRVPAIPPELITLLRNFSFPGNVRELESMIYDALSRHRSGRISLEVFREKLGFAEDDADWMHLSAAPEAGGNTAISFPDELPNMREFEEMLINEALRRTDGNQRQAAELLGLSRRALNNRLMRRDS